FAGTISRPRSLNRWSAFAAGATATRRGWLAEIERDPMSCNQVRDAAQAMQDRIVAWRRDFHKHPEVGFQEVRTSGIVADELDTLGLNVRRGCPRTAVSADLRVPGAKSCILLRADMDALPVQENSGE